MLKIFRLEQFAKYTTISVLFAIIIVVGFIIRIWGLGSAEIFHDEGLYAFRSIGYVDYIQNPAQTTPVEWFSKAPLPWWTHLSFHDAPPLFFLIQHVFFRLFGDSLFVARLPSLIAGMVAIWLMFLIGRRILKLHYERNIAETDWGEHSNPPAGRYARSASNVSFGIPIGDIAGLLAALFLAVNHVHIWISRSSLIESLLLTLLLANSYFFLRLVSGESDRIAVWIWFGITLGLSFLTKYTTILLIPLYVGYLVLTGGLVGFLKDKKFYGALFLALIVFSPVIVYNIALYMATGHFDLQIAYVLGQKAPEWQGGLLGKVLEPFRAIVANLPAMYSMPFLLVLVGSFLFLATLWKKLSKKERRFFLFCVIALIDTTFILMLQGSAYRFLVLYAPFAIMLIVLAVFVLISRAHLNKYLLFALLAIFLLGELWFSISGIFIEFPRLGTVVVDQYFDSVWGDVPSQTLPQVNNIHLDALARRYATTHGAGEINKLIVYDDNLIISARLWIFARRFYYHGIPTVSVDVFKNLLQERGTEYFKDYEIYFVKINQKSVVANQLFFNPRPQELENFLRSELRQEPVLVTYAYQPLPNGNYEKVPSFSIYKIDF